MEKFLGYRCSLCDQEYGTHEITYTCPKDGGNLDVVLDVQAIHKKLGSGGLPTAGEPSLWRYLPLLPVSDPGGLDTPLHAAGWTPVFELPRLAQALRPYTVKFRGSSPDEALKALATWIETSFVEWKNMAVLTGVLGKGPVPTFAPPYVPVGPVVHGEIQSAGAVFAGPRFGRIAI